MKFIKKLLKPNVRINNMFKKLNNNIIDDIERNTGREYAKTFHKCPMCVDCPDNCPLDK